MVSSLLLAAVVVLFGSTFGPVVTVNPYDLLGYCIAIVVLLYVIFYYHYNRTR
jgi:membrane protein DedA with SNARE-associated domain